MGINSEDDMSDPEQRIQQILDGLGAVQGVKYVNINGFGILVSMFSLIRNLIISKDLSSLIK